MQKKIIRNKIRQTINNLPSSYRYIASQQMTDLILSSLTEKPLLNNAKNIACYWPTEYEINTIELINDLIKNNKLCYLPNINHSTNTLDFIRYTNKTKLIKNKFGILEPEFDINKKINIMELDIIFMPLTAFDSHGHRIGSGSGLYDRTLVRDDKKISYTLIGLAYSNQQISNFIPNDWDIDLDFAVTEQEWFNFSKTYQKNN